LEKLFLEELLLLKDKGFSPYITGSGMKRALAPEGCYSRNSPDAPTFFVATERRVPYKGRI
jgi:hypothetical protein